MEVFDRFQCNFDNLPHAVDFGWPFLLYNTIQKFVGYKIMVTTFSPLVLNSAIPIFLMINNI